VQARFWKYPQPRASPHIKTCEKFSGETEAKQEEGGGHYEKRKCHPKNEVNKANREVGFMKNEIPSLLMDEKVCFMRLSPDTQQNFWQVIPTKWKSRELNQNTFPFPGHSPWWVQGTCFGFIQLRRLVVGLHGTYCDVY
jgi:hypothetical protein